jgi:transposase
LESLLARRERCYRYPNRKALLDRSMLHGILYVLPTGIQWEYLLKELGLGLGMTCWRHFRDWNEADV